MSDVASREVDPTVGSVVHGKGSGSPRERGNRSVMLVAGVCLMCPWKSSVKGRLSGDKHEKDGSWRISDEAEMVVRGGSKAGMSRTL